MAILTATGNVVYPRNQVIELIYGFLGKTRGLKSHLKGLPNNVLYYADFRRQEGANKAEISRIIKFNQRTSALTPPLVMVTMTVKEPPIHKKSTRICESSQLTLSLF